MCKTNRECREQIFGAMNFNTPETPSGTLSHMSHTPVYPPHHCSDYETMRSTSPFVLHNKYSKVLTADDEELLLKNNQNMSVLQFQMTRVPRIHFKHQIIGIQISSNGQKSKVMTENPSNQGKNVKTFLFY